MPASRSSIPTAAATLATRAVPPVSTRRSAITAAAAVALAEPRTRRRPDSGSSAAWPFRGRAATMPPSPPAIAASRAGEPETPGRGAEHRNVEEGGLRQEPGAATAKVSGVGEAERVEVRDVVGGKQDRALLGDVLHPLDGPLERTPEGRTQETAQHS
jgi:hypothetical protein